MVGYDIAIGVVVAWFLLAGVSWLVKHHREKAQRAAADARREAVADLLYPPR
jgi:hypothetical protein